MPINQSVRKGCLIGFVLGDVLGAPFEGGFVERLLWAVIGRRLNGEMRYTDDTQMSLDLLESLKSCNGFSASDVAVRFASGYHWSRGYGPGTSKVLRKIKKGMPWEEARFSAFSKGSWGNGGAMRAPVIAIYYCADETVERILLLSREQAAITHAHRDAQDGAALIAAVVFYVLKYFPVFGKLKILNMAINAVQMDELWRSRIEIALEWTGLQDNEHPKAKVVAQKLGNGTAAIDSCVTAIYIAFRCLDKEFSELLDFSRECGGDVDTICSMAGAIYGAANGYRPFEIYEDIAIENKDKILKLAAC